MAQSQLQSKTNTEKEKKNSQQIIIIRDNITITVYHNSIHLKQTDDHGKTKSLNITRENWFDLLFYQNIIESCFHKFDQQVSAGKRGKDLNNMS